MPESWRVVILREPEKVLGKANGLASHDTSPFRSEPHGNTFAVLRPNMLEWTIAKPWNRPMPDSVEGTPMLQTALKYDLSVPADGHIELHVPFPSGAHITVFVVEEPAEQFDDLLAAAESSLSFWDNPLDDEDWNHA